MKINNYLCWALLYNGCCIGRNDAELLVCLDTITENQSAVIATTFQYSLQLQLRIMWDLPKIALSSVAIVNRSINRLYDLFSAVVHPLDESHLFVLHRYRLLLTLCVGNFPDVSHYSM